MEGRIRSALAARYDEQVAQAASLQNLGGHASLRIYWRVTLPPGLASARNERTVMAMVMPLEGGTRSDEGPSAEGPQELPFVDVQRLLRAANLPCPAIDLVDMTLGVVLLEDLGDVMFEQLYHRLDATEPEGIFALYQRAIALLVRTQHALRQRDTLPKSLAWTRAFDATLLRWELDHYREWGLRAQYGADVLSPEQDALMTELFDQLVRELLRLDQTTVLRDYQSRNIMYKANKLVLIDFQDALQGPFIYDLVALLRDSYIGLEGPMVEALVLDYAAAGREAGLPWCDDDAAVLRAFHLQTVQRKLKDAGRFVFIDRVKHNPSFLGYYTPSISYVAAALKALPELSALEALLAEVEPAWPA